VKRFRRRGKIIPFRRPRRENDSVQVPEGLLGARMSVTHLAVMEWLNERIAEIPEDDHVDALAEMRAQAIVIGGIGRYLREVMPKGQRDWIDNNVESFAAWLGRRRGW